MTSLVAVWGQCCDGVSLPESVLHEVTWVARHWLQWEGLCLRNRHAPQIRSAHPQSQLVNTYQHTRLQPAPNLRNLTDNLLGLKRSHETHSLARSGLGVCCSFPKQQIRFQLPGHDLILLKSFVPFFLSLLENEH